MLEAFWFDLRHAVRLLMRTKRETAIAVAMLAIGIGANTAMFSAIRSVVLQPLPFRDRDRLIRLRDSMTSADGQVHAVNMSSRSVLAVQRGATIFDGLAAFSGTDMTMLGGERPERVRVVLQAERAMETLGVGPVTGRGFTSEEQRAGLSSGVALVSDAFWRTRLGGASGVLGSKVRLDDRTVTIVGVMPPAYAFPYEAQFWLPFALDPADRSRDFAVLVRMRDGVTIDQARAALSSVAADVRRTYADAAHGYGIEVMTLRENLVGRQDAPLRALAGIVTVLLLIACVNVATMLLARAVSRRREFAVRCALGASRRRHATQLLTESLVLTLAGCVCGLMLTAWIVPLTSTLFPPVLSEQLGVSPATVDVRVLGFAIVASLLSAVVAGAVPAFGSWTASPQAALADGSRTLGFGPHGRRLLSGLVVAETTLTLVLLAGAGLVIRHFVRLVSEPLGFAAHGLLTLEVSPGATAYPGGPKRSELIHRIVEELRATPGIVAAAATTVNPLGGGTWGAPAITEDAAARDPNASFNVNHRLVTPGLFETMGIPLLRGRSFTTQDADGRQPVVIVSQRLARRFWPDREAVGERIRLARPDAPWLTVVGVVGDVSDSHDPGVPFETWYLPLAQHAATPAAEKFNLMVRTTGDAIALAADAQRAVARVDPTLPAYAPAAMDDYRSGTLRRERTSAAFMLGFGVFGLVLAALGVYGVVAFSVAHRTSEIGLRIALGAQRRDIVPIVVRGSIVLVAIGAAAGAAAAGAVNRVLAALLADAGAVDVAVLSGATALILAVSALACLMPAVRAARLDPIQALKVE